jgi:methylase of polypeptide subunit release factors
LNRRPNLEARVGSWFDPVAGESFDQIVCNPPYVISPESKRLFRDGGYEGDGLCAQLVRSIPKHLNPGGVGQILVNWIVTTSGHEPLDEWNSDCGCDVFLQRLERFDPADYARHWLGERADGPAFAEWLSYYDRFNAGAIGSGVLTLTRRM